ncbi:hypothetical protein H5410_058097 [Solanum commersonii]|uniref:Uncharacterized protein n=1 Tax=Solanum commersonii TaxID=4109 RepID=A0A9J5WPR6_SOLCO|nr:hypothetical protein H5410_058097 [Solanum commersonii]
MTLDKKLWRSRIRVEGVECWKQEASTQYGRSCSSLELNMIAPHFGEFLMYCLICVFLPLHIALLEMG